jgi:hypothetical protein
VEVIMESERRPMMSSANLEKLIEEVKALTLDEKRKLHATLNELLASPQPTEEDFKRAMLDAGLLNSIEPREVDLESFNNYEPVEVEGKPVSETIIEERR